MIHLGLIGYPLGHSLSPKIHSAALKACGLQGDYSIFPIHPDDKPGLKVLLERVRTGEIQGLNVTIPYKQSVIEFLDELTPIAQIIGAVNTIYVRNNKLIGDNADAQGFLSDLKNFLSESLSPNSGERTDVREKSALVLGAGGSARAVTYALSNDGWNVTLAARRIEQAQELAMQFETTRVIEFNLSTFQSPTFNLIINTTPIGMAPNIDQSPISENVMFPQRVMIYDLVYNPRETKFVKNARAQGLHATTGLGMLIEQAALSFEIWTGQNPPMDVLHASVFE